MCVGVGVCGGVCRHVTRYCMPSYTLESISLAETIRDLPQNGSFQESKTRKSRVHQTEVCSRNPLTCLILINLVTIGTIKAKRSKENSTSQLLYVIIDVAFQLLLETLIFSEI